MGLIPNGVPREKLVELESLAPEDDVLVGPILGPEGGQFPFRGSRLSSAMDSTAIAAIIAIRARCLGIKACLLLGFWRAGSKH